MSLKKVDEKIFKLTQSESKRQQETLMLIPSENYASQAVEEAVGSRLGNKYAEGYPKKRYYQGQKFVDEIEITAQERAKSLFGVPHANVQPYSGSPANSAVQMAVLNPGDKIMGMNLSSGGHLTHGHPKITFSGKFFKSVQYGVKKDGWIDYDKVEALVLKEKPQLIITGYTAYPRVIDFARFGQIADKVGAYLLADISHISGLVVSGVHPSPVDHAHLVMTTTHKTLRGPRGAMVMVTQKGTDKDENLPKKVDKAVFPGLQGGPHINAIAGIAVALREAQDESFKKYGQKIVKNAKILAKNLVDMGYTLVTNGTENHLMLIDLRPQEVSGKQAAVALEKAGLVVNANGIPHDPNPPYRPSGIRLGTPAVTSRDMGDKEMIQIADWIDQVIKNYEDESRLNQIAQEVKNLCQNFPLKKQYGLE